MMKPMARIINDRPGNDPDPGPDPTAPEDLTGPVAAHYKKLGGKNWGLPLHGPRPFDGGQYVSFRPTTQRFFTKAIFWSPRTGAHVVHKRIFEAWVRGGHGVAGHPTSDAVKTHDNTGEWQTFEHATYVSHADTGAFEVHGDIRARYTELGGSAFGYPTTSETGTPDGRGRFNHFRDLATGAEKSIYWTQETGAHEVFGYIRHAWAAKGWERSVLSYPTSGEMNTHDGIGRFQTFEGGIYVWHPDTGAFEVHGAILERYGQLGGSAWGYPITDEGDAKGPGRFNHFRELPSGHEKSIHWSPQTGAVEVFGLIRQRWAELGWERSHLGYPKGHEVPWTAHDGEAGVEQAFQGGRMLWTPRMGAVADPMRWTRNINRTAGEVKGDVVVTLASDGTARFGGKVRATRWPSFDYDVQVMVRTAGNHAIAFAEHGRVHGTNESGPRERRFDQSSNSPALKALFKDFHNAELVVERKYDKDFFGGTIGDIAEGVLGWVAGSILVATPGVGLLLVAGTTLSTLVSGGSFASGMRVVGGTLWLAGPHGTLFAIAADALARLASKEETLGQAEYDVANLVFKGTLPPRDKLRISNAIGASGRPFTFPRFDDKIVMSIGDGFDDPLKGFGKYSTYGELLLHEITHAWQYHHNPSHIGYILDGITSSNYNPGTNASKGWDSFNLEQQATIVENWFLKYYKKNADPKPENDYGLAVPAATQDPWFHHIRDRIRKGRR